MRKYLAVLLALISLLGLMGCAAASGPEMVTVVKTYDVTNTEQIQEYVREAKTVTVTKYYEMSDGTWKTDQYSYQYRLVLTGNLNASRDVTYTVLSNNPNITFDQAWKASGLSSNLGDYFKEEDAKIVAIQ